MAKNNLFQYAADLVLELEMAEQITKENNMVLKHSNLNRPTTLRPKDSNLNKTTTTQPKDKKIACPSCSYKSSSQTDVERHYLTKLTSQKGVICKKYDLNFTTKHDKK
jgi:hypothetical protein